MKTKSVAKQKVFEFSKLKLESDFVFRYKGTKEEAERFVHRMRVELARVRKVVREQGRIIKPFKMIQKEIIADNEHTGYIKVTLRKTMHQYNPSEAIDEIFDDIAGGEIING